MTRYMFTKLFFRKNKISIDDKMLLFACIPAMVFFTLIAKKQVFYTLPILVPLAVWVGQWRRWAPFIVLGGFLGWLSIGWGVGNIGKPWLPAEWTAPRHTLAKPPTFDTYPTKDAFAVLPTNGQQILVLSQDNRLYEGFLALLLREAFPERKVRGAILDPEGAVEQLHEVDHFVWVGKRDTDWPTIKGIQDELKADHYELGELPSIAEHLYNSKDLFNLMGSWPIYERGSTTESHIWLYVFERKRR